MDRIEIRFQYFNPNFIILYVFTNNTILSFLDSERSKEASGFTMVFIFFYPFRHFHVGTKIN